MACYPLKTSTVTGMVCTGRQRRSKCMTPNCGKLVEALCDYPVTRKGKRTTCRAKLCTGCRVQKDDATDYCPPHARLVDARQRQPERGDVRIHIETGFRLWVLGVTDGAVTFARNPPDRSSRCVGVRQTVEVDKWIAKTRPAGAAGKCKGCEAPIEWFRSADGKNIPLDTVEHPDGNIVIDHDGVALYAERGSFPLMFLSHFATCVEADRFRRKKT